MTTPKSPDRSGTNATPKDAASQSSHQSLPSASDSVTSTPALILHNRQRKIAFQMPWIQGVVLSALPDCLAAALPRSPLPTLTTIEASLISDKTIASVHNEFFQDPTPTDVITFDHGEILVGAGVVATQAPEFAHTPSEEAALCIIHGMLHLGGWKDKTRKDAKAMAKTQIRIFRRASG